MWSSHGCARCSSAVESLPPLNCRIGRLELPIMLEDHRRGGGRCTNPLPGIGGILHACLGSQVVGLHGAGGEVAAGLAAEAGDIAVDVGLALAGASVVAGQLRGVS